MTENINKKLNKTKSHQYSSKQRQLQRQHENTVWSIEDVVDGPKIEMVGGKKRKMYKVRWRFDFLM